MAASAAVDVVGTAPISFTDSTGAQKSVPLSALRSPAQPCSYRGRLAPELTRRQTRPRCSRLQTPAQSAGELTPPPTRPPSPAIAVTASHPGPESNNIVVAVAVTGDPSQPLSAKIKFSASSDGHLHRSDQGGRSGEGDRRRHPVRPPGSPPAGTGVVAVMSSSVATVAILPADHQHHDGLTSGRVRRQGRGLLDPLHPCPEDRLQRFGRVVCRRGTGPVRHDVHGHRDVRLSHGVRHPGAGCASSP